MVGGAPKEPRANEIVGAREAKQAADKQVKEMDKEFEPKSTDTATRTETATATGTATRTK